MLAENLGSTSENDDNPNDSILTMEKETWIMFFDGTVNLFVSDIGPILISPYGQH